MIPIRLTATAKADLLEIWLYAATENTAAADRLIDELTASYQRLAEFPELGRSRDELCQGCRSLPVKKYLIFYRLLPQAIEIIRVLHGSRNLPEFF
jgi:toxin ParE1/3/4